MPRKYTHKKAARVPKDPIFDAGMEKVALPKLYPGLDPDDYIQIRAALLETLKRFPDKSKWPDHIAAAMPSQEEMQNYVLVDDNEPLVTRLLQSLKNLSGAGAPTLTGDLAGSFASYIKRGGTADKFR